MRIAILGNGIAGLSTACFLDHWHRAMLYERHDYTNGHSNTQLVETEATQLWFRSVFTSQAPKSAIFF